MDHHGMRTECPLPRWSPGGISTCKFLRLRLHFCELNITFWLLNTPVCIFHIAHRCRVENVIFSHMTCCWWAIRHLAGALLNTFHCLSLQLTILLNIAYLALLALHCTPYKIFIIHSNWDDDFRCVVYFNWLSMIWSSEQWGIALWKKKKNVSFPSLKHIIVWTEAVWLFICGFSWSFSVPLLMWKVFYLIQSVMLTTVSCVNKYLIPWLGTCGTSYIVWLSGFGSIWIIALQLVWSFRLHNKNWLKANRRQLAIKKTINMKVVTNSTWSKLCNLALFMLPTCW